MMDDNDAQIIGEQDAVILGRGMYDEWSGYWPSVRGHPFADFINGVKKYVVTPSPLATRWHNAAPVSGPVDDLVGHIKAQSGANTGVHGTIQLAQSLLDRGLVDELQLLVGPAFGLSGRRLFPNDDVRQLALLNATPTPSGSLLLLPTELKRRAALLAQARPMRPMRTTTADAGPSRSCITDSPYTSGRHVPARTDGQDQAPLAANLVLSRIRTTDS